VVCWRVSQHHQLPFLPLFSAGSAVATLTCFGSALNWSSRRVMHALCLIACWCVACMSGFAAIHTLTWTVCDVLGASLSHTFLGPHSSSCLHSLTPPSTELTAITCPHHALCTPTDCRCAVAVLPLSGDHYPPRCRWGGHTTLAVAVVRRQRAQALASQDSVSSRVTCK
jgi:hypothetical protein